MHNSLIHMAGHSFHKLEEVSCSFLNVVILNSVMNQRHVWLFRMEREMAFFSACDGSCIVKGQGRNKHASLKKLYYIYN